MSQAKQVDNKVQTLSSVEVLECSVCYERYDDNKRCPRLLSNCGHTFCTYCLEQLLKNGNITCPQDRKDVAVSAGVGGLPKNFALLDVLLANSNKRSDTPVKCDTCGEEGHLATSFCLECKENMCDVAALFHTRLKLSRDHRVVSIAELKANPHLAAIPVFCSEHNEPFRYFDNDCGQVICRDCFALKHNGHKCCSLAEASAQSRQELEALASKARAIAAKLKEAENRAMTIVSDLNWKKNLEEARIHAFFEELHAALESREQALVMELSQVHKAKSFTLTEQCDLLRTFQACLLSAVDRAVTAIQSAGDVHLLVAKSDIATTLLAMGSQAPVQEPQADSALEFCIGTSRLLGVLGETGRVTDKSTCADFTSAAGPGLEEAYIGREASFIITARDHQGTLRSAGGDSFVVELKGEKGENVEVKIADEKSGKYSATYILPVDIKGELQLSVWFHGTHIQGSPYRVRTGGVLHYIGVADWMQSKQPYQEQWRLMDEACAALPRAPPGSRAATCQEYVEGKIEGLPRIAPGNVFFTGPGSEGRKDGNHCMKGVHCGRALEGQFSADSFHTGMRQAICVAYK